MKTYRHILFALELDEGGDAVPVKRVGQLMQGSCARLTLVHAVECMSGYGAAYGVVPSVEIEQVLYERAQVTMAKIAKELGVDENDQLIKIGPAQFVILEEAKARGIDLIVVGSHGRHGVRLLLGSTANAVLHGATCDVLAVRIPDKD